MSWLDDAERKRQEAAERKKRKVKEELRERQDSELRLEELFEELDPMISSNLEDMGSRTWGEGNFTFRRTRGGDYYFVTLEWHAFAQWDRDPYYWVAVVTARRDGWVHGTFKYRSGYSDHLHVGEIVAVVVGRSQTPHLDALDELEKWGRVGIGSSNVIERNEFDEATLRQRLSRLYIGR